MLTYNPKNLKEQFPQLGHLKDSTLFPILDTAVNGWLKQMPDSVVSDIKILTKHDYSFPYNSYNCVVNGKIVSINISCCDIDICDEDEFWYMASNVHFSGDEAATTNLFERFREFVERQGLENLVSKSKEELKKGKTYHLSCEMCNFYLEGAFTQATFRSR